MAVFKTFFTVFNFLPIFSATSPPGTPENPFPESNTAEPQSNSSSNYSANELVAQEKGPLPAPETMLQPCDEKHPPHLPTEADQVADDQASTSDSRPSTASPSSAAADVHPDSNIDTATLLQSIDGSHDMVNTTTTVVPASQSLLSHPVIENLRNQELGKTVLSIAVPVTTGLIAYFFTQKSPPFIMFIIVIALSIGCTAIWNGLLLRETYRLTANAIEQIGIAIVLLAFHGLVGSFLPPKLLWIPGLFGSLTVVPFVLAALPTDQPLLDTSNR